MLDRTEHLILLVKCVVIEVIIALFLSGQMSGPCHFSSCKLNRCHSLQLVLSPIILKGKMMFLKSLFFSPFALHLDLQVILLFHYWIDSWSCYLCANVLFKKQNKTTTSLCPGLTCFLVSSVDFFLKCLFSESGVLWVSIPPLAPPFLQGIIQLFSANLFWLIYTRKAVFSVKLLLIHSEHFH